MKRLTSGLIALAFVASLPAAGFAQGTSTTDRAKEPERRITDKREKKERPTWSNTQGLHESRDLLGAKVHAADGRELGELEALLIEPKDGKVTHAVIGYGGRLGIGEEKVVVPYSAMKMAGHESSKKAKITMDQSVLENAPKYVKSKDRAPSASPATAPRSSDKVGANQTDAKSPDKKY